MGRGDNVVEKRVDSVTEQLAMVKSKLEEAGIESAEIGFANTGILGVGTPVIKSVRVGKSPIEVAAQADPGNISQVAASQLEISNTYYHSVLHQAQQSFKWALIGAGVGLLFFVAAIGFLLFDQSETVSGISVISGALVEVLSGVNFWLYRQTARQLEIFHSRLEQTQRFILANSVCENLEGEFKENSRAELVRTISNSISGSGWKPSAAKQAAGSADA